MMVVRVDKEKGYIDLSKKKVNAEEAQQTERNYKKAKVVHNIMKAVAIQLKEPVLNLYEKWGWDLYDNFEHALDGLKVLNGNPEKVFAKLDITAEEKVALQGSVAKRMAPKPVKIRAEFKLSCLRKAGVNAIKEALLTARDTVNDADFEFKFKMIAAPIYMIEISTLERDKAIAKMKQAFVILRDTVNKYEGSFKKMHDPIIVGANEDDPEELLRQP